MFDARAGKQQFFTNFHAAASQEVFQERPGLLFLKTSPKKPSFIILQTWILPDYTTQYTNTALKTSRKLCLLVVERYKQTCGRNNFCTSLAEIPRSNVSKGAQPLMYRWRRRSTPASRGGMDCGRARTRSAPSSCRTSTSS